jgi:hypothetical protein
VEGVQEVDREFEYASAAGAAAWPCFLALGSTSGGGSGGQASRARAPHRPNVLGAPPLTSVRERTAAAELLMSSFQFLASHVVRIILYSVSCLCTACVSECCRVVIHSFLAVQISVSECCRLYVQVVLLCCGLKLFKLASHVCFHFRWFLFGENG